MQVLMCWLLKMTKIAKFYLELIDYKLAYTHQAVIFSEKIFFFREKKKYLNLLALTSEYSIV